MPRPPRPRVLLLADCSKPEVMDVLGGLRPVLDERVVIDQHCATDDEPLPADLNADMAVAIGGDGTLITQARRIIRYGPPGGLPLVGVNMGRLGFLAEFDPRSLIEHADAVFSGRASVVEHMLLAMDVVDGNGNAILTTIAMNDGVITAGEPFQMIELSLKIDGTSGPTLNGDGVIVSTPVGSTAYNVSAGGPIVHPRVEALTITPLAAHSLAFRPIVVRADSEVRIELCRANPGTALVADGSVAALLEAGHTVVFRRDGRTVKLVLNPAATYWRILLDKLRWAVPPTYREGAAGRRS
jgi:NAD+ kinase